MSMSACFAAGLGGFDFADLDTPLFLATNPFRGGYALNGGLISVKNIEAGHGVVPRGEGKSSRRERWEPGFLPRVVKRE
jgi:hypothetical protein